MKRFVSLLFLAGMLPFGSAAGQEIPDAVPPRPVVGIELRGDTTIYRPVPGWDDVVADDAGMHYRLKPVRGVTGPRHAVSLEIGAYPACGTRSIIPGTGCDDDFYYGNFPGSFPGVRTYYEGPLRMSGAVGGSYTYRVRRWLEVGVSVTYAGFYRNLRYSADRSIAGRLREHYLTVMPLLRFSWLNTRTVRLYSSFQFGWQWGHEQSYFFGLYNYNYAAVQITPFGVSVGRRVYGYAELGIGMRGLFTVGVGYRFGSAKK